MSKPAVLPELKTRLSPNFSKRRTPISLGVLHDTEGSYEGACSWLCTPTTYNVDGSVKSGPDASAHVVLREDGLEATQLVKYADKAWSCEAFNSVSLNLEMAGYASKPYQQHQLDVAARIMAFWCHEFGIPARLSDGSRPGITFHQLLGQAGGGHHDPGFSRTKRLWFVFKVKQELRRGGFLNQWGQ